MTRPTQNYSTEMYNKERHEYIFVKTACLLKNLTNIIPSGSDDKLGSKFIGDRKAFGKLRSVSYMVLFCILCLIVPEYK